MENLSPRIHHPTAFQFASGSRILRTIKHALDTFAAERDQVQIAITLSEAGDFDGARAVLREYPVHG